MSLQPSVRRADFLTQLKHGFRLAAKQGLLAEDVKPRHAAVGLHALVDGLIMNWVLDPSYFPLAKAAAGMVNRYMKEFGTGKETTRNKRPLQKLNF